QGLNRIVPRFSSSRREVLVLAKGAHSPHAISRLHAGSAAQSVSERSFARGERRLTWRARVRAVRMSDVACEVQVIDDDIRLVVLLPFLLVVAGLQVTLHEDTGALVEVPRERLRARPEHRERVPFRS